MTEAKRDQDELSIHEKIFFDLKKAIDEIDPEMDKRRFTRIPALLASLPSSSKRYYITRIKTIISDLMDQQSSNSWHRQTIGCLLSFLYGPENEDLQIDLTEISDDTLEYYKQLDPVPVPESPPIVGSGMQTPLLSRSAPAAKEFKLARPAPQKPEPHKQADRNLPLFAAESLVAYALQHTPNEKMPSIETHLQHYLAEWNPKHRQIYVAVLLQLAATHNKPTAFCTLRNQFFPAAPPTNGQAPANGLEHAKEQVATKAEDIAAFLKPLDIEVAKLLNLHSSTARSKLEIHFDEINRSLTQELTKNYEDSGKLMKISAVIAAEIALVKHCADHKSSLDNKTAAFQKVLEMCNKIPGAENAEKLKIRNRLIFISVASVAILAILLLVPAVADHIFDFLANSLKIESQGGGGTLFVGALSTVTVPTVYKWRAHALDSHSYAHSVAKNTTAFFDIKTKGLVEEKAFGVDLAASPRS